ncbi:MAG TPA: single-stranded-DNA-specific exonuclease RecJ [Patescibacteria group bacterium]|nr:single-stranded-DNA-specific exonuclease RecJ [Patescibacteria group bacterium]
MEKGWNIQNLADDKYKEQFKGWDDIVVQMLFNRGIKNKKEAEKFFDPKYDEMYDPFLLKDMDKAVKRTIEALNKNENIVIFGDYDVDGITSTAVVYNILEKLKAKVSFYIPHRMQEGYGLNKKAIDFLKNKKTDLIITVDNGVSNKEEVAYAKKKGIDTVITDHHEVPNVLPNAVAVVNPKRKDSKYPFRDLAGVGVAFKLVCALVAEINKKKKKEVISPGYLKWYLDLVALGTISDIVPLIDENRIIAHFGLVVLTKTRNVGLKALEKVAGIDFKNSDPYMVGFQIAPRLNAAGRMAHAATALELLLATDEGEAGVLAMKLDKLNHERQDTILHNMDILRKRYSTEKIENIMLLKDEKWTSGIIGLIAGRISEEFSRPVFCMAEEAGVIKGSVRSSVDLNVVETLRIFEKIFINYGGHRGAGGFSLKSENYELFEMQVLQYGRNKLKEEELVSVLDIEKEIEFKEITQQLFKEIKKFEPFGHGNNEPLFVTYGVKVKEAKKVGKDATHTKLKLTKDGKEFSAILFNHGEMGDQLYYGKDLDIVYKISENEWNGRKSLELKIEDLK